MANRALLFDRIGHALERREHAPIAVLFIDLDDFKAYAAKGGGKGCYRSFEPSMLAGAVERLALAADLQRAVDRDEIELHYQPVVDLGTGRRAASRRSARWTHPRARRGRRRTSSSRSPSRAA